MGCAKARIIVSSEQKSVVGNGWDNEDLEDLVPRVVGLEPV